MIAIQRSMSSVSTRRRRASYSYSRVVISVQSWITPHVDEIGEMQITDRSYISRATLDRPLSGASLHPNAARRAPDPPLSAQRRGFVRRPTRIVIASRQPFQIKRNRGCRQAEPRGAAPSLSGQDGALRHSETAPASASPSRRGGALCDRRRRRRLSRTPRRAEISADRGVRRWRARFGSDRARRLPHRARAPTVLQDLRRECRPPTASGPTTWRGNSLRGSTSSAFCRRKDRRYALRPAR